MKAFPPPGRRARQPRRSLASVFAIPALLLLASLAGLILALTGDGARDWVSAALLSVPLLTLAAAWMRRG